MDMTGRGSQTSREPEPSWDPNQWGKEKEHYHTQRCNSHPVHLLLGGKIFQSMFTICLHIRKKKKEKRTSPLTNPAEKTASKSYSPCLHLEHCWKRRDRRHQLVESGEKKFCLEQGRSDVFRELLTMWLQPPFFSIQILHLGHWGNRSIC